MDKITYEQAMQDQEFNAKLAEQQPEKQKEFLDEYMYCNPNDYDEMKELYEYYEYKYSRNLWALQQVAYNEASEKGMK